MPAPTPAAAVTAADPYRGPMPTYGTDARPTPVKGETRYKAASRSRDVFGAASIDDADGATLHDLPTLRARSAELCRNNPLALAAGNAEVTNVVGTGLRLNASVDREALKLSDTDADAIEAQLEAEWRLFSESPNSDLARGLSFPAQQALAYRSHFERGDHFIAFVSLQQPRPGWPYSFALQHIEADRVSNPHHQRDTERLVAGMEKDAQGAPIAIHVANQHPGALLRHGQPLTWTRLPIWGQRTGRRLVLHLTQQLRPGQTRGVPALAPVLEVLKQLDKYIDAEVDRAANSALFMAFLTTRDELSDTFGPERDEFHSSLAKKIEQGKYAIGPSSVARLYPGDTLEFADPKSPNPNAEVFIKTFATLVGAALEIPAEVLLRHFSSSYSAARGALLMAWQHFNQRRDWLATNPCQPTYEAVITDAIAAGRLSLPGFMDDPFARQAWLGADWIGDAPQQIDENKAVSAARERVEAGFSTHKRETAQLTGQDYDHVRRQRAKEARMEPQQMAMDLPSADDLDREDER